MVFLLFINQQITKSSQEPESHTKGSEEPVSHIKGSQEPESHTKGSEEPQYQPEMDSKFRHRMDIRSEVQEIAF
jgi:hypothetical protein